MEKAKEFGGVAALRALGTVTSILQCLRNPSLQESWLSKLAGVLGGGDELTNAII